MPGLFLPTLPQSHCPLLSQFCFLKIPNIPFSFRSCIHFRRPGCCSFLPCFYHGLNYLFLRFNSLSHAAILPLSFPSRFRITSSAISICKSVAPFRHDTKLRSVAGREVSACTVSVCIIIPPPLLCKHAHISHTVLFSATLQSPRTA